MILKFSTHEGFNGQILIQILFFGHQGLDFLKIKIKMVGDSLIGNEMYWRIMLKYDKVDYAFCLIIVCGLIMQIIYIVHLLNTQ